jgi:hypothetical protein
MEVIIGGSQCAIVGTLEGLLEILAVPILVVLVLFAVCALRIALMVLKQGSSGAPFIYTLFRRQKSYFQTHFLPRLAGRHG